EFDLVVIVVGSSARFYPELAVQPIIDSAGSDKPMAVFLVPEAPQARAALGQAGVANFYTPEACADAVAAALARRTPTPLPGGGRSAAQRPVGGDSASAFSARPYHPTPDHLRWFDPPPSGESGPSHTLDELEGYAVLDRLGIPHAPSVALD